MRQRIYSPLGLFWASAALSCVLLLGVLWLAGHAAPTRAQNVTLQSTIFLPYIKQQAEPFANIQLETASAPFYANSNATIPLTATVLDSQGNPTLGATVTFSTSLGLFAAPSPAPVIEATTGPDGRTEVRLQPVNSYETDEYVTVQARISTTRGEIISQTERLRLQPPQLERLELTARDERLPANGTISTVLTLLAEDMTATPMPDYPLMFETTVGLFANERSTIEARTDSEGIATVELRTVFDIETVTAQVTARPQVGATTTTATTAVDFVAPSRLIVQALPDTIPAAVNSSGFIIATVRGEGDLLMSDYPVDFVTPLGDFANGSATTRIRTDSEGIARAELFGAPQVADTTVTVQAGTQSSEIGVTYTVAACNDAEPNDEVPLDNDVTGLDAPKKQVPADCRATLEDDEEGEDDYYHLRLDPDQTLTVELTEVPAGADYDIILYDTNQTFLAFSNNLGAADESFSYTWTGETEQLFYIRVNMATKAVNAENTYRLRVDLDPWERDDVTVLASEPTDAPGPFVDPPLPSKP